MPCHLVVFNPETRDRREFDCDEEQTARLVEDDHAGKAGGSYTDVAGQSFEADWTKDRLIGFQRRRDDGSLIASGGADGAHTPAC